MLFLASFTSIISEAASDINPARRQQHDVKHAFDRVTMGLNDHLAVVVPTHRGELPRVASSLQQWPSSCSPVTKRSVDLVLYYAEGDEDSEAAKEVVEVTTATAGLCFATTRVVYAYLDDEVRPHTFCTTLFLCSLRAKCFGCFASVKHTPRRSPRRFGW